jgi:WbqC-like protein family
MIVTIHQPDFLPWIGFFNKVRLSELLVIGDSVQYRDKGYQNRNRIKTAVGAQWLTVPILHNWGQSILDVQIATNPQNGRTWHQLHMKTLQVNYSKAPYYDQYIGIFEKMYKKPQKLLADSNLEMLKSIFEILDINVPMKRVSEICQKTNIVEICKAVGADTYLSGPIGGKYMNEDFIIENKIRILWNNYEHPVYKQLFMKLGFMPYMSIIDLIFNEGPESLEIIKSGFKGFSKPTPELLTSIAVSSSSANIPKTIIPNNSRPAVRIGGIKQGIEKFTSKSQSMG